MPNRVSPCLTEDSGRDLWTGKVPPPVSLECRHMHQFLFSYQVEVAQPRASEASEVRRDSLLEGVGAGECLIHMQR